VVSSMPLLFEELTFEPARVKDTETVLPIFVQVQLTCPVCGEPGFTSYQERDEHIKTEHPLQWYFWYAPYGKPLLAFTGVSAFGLLIVGLNKAFPPTPRR